VYLAEFPANGGRIEGAKDHKVLWLHWGYRGWDVRSQSRQALDSTHSPWQGNHLPIIMHESSYCFSTS